MSGRYVDLTGRTFGRLTVIERVGSQPSKNGTHATWRCRCDCGEERTVTTRYLDADASCGTHRRRTKHGHTWEGGKSITYKSWESMIARCTYPSNPAYAHYAARGITVADRWRDFSNFLADMGKRENLSFSLDRIDNDRGYEPGNCRWATKREQANNRVTNKRFEYRGTLYTLPELSRVSGVPKERLRSRLVRPGGWTVEEATSRPRLRKGMRQARS